MKQDTLRTFLGDALPRTRDMCHRLGLGRPWWALRRLYESGTQPVCPRLHGRRLWLTPGNPYPFIVRELPRFNAGLVAAVRTLHRTLERPLHLIDVGAAVGDTVVLLSERCPGMVATYECIDGSSTFAPYFAENTRNVPGVRFHAAMLAATATRVPSLVQHHAGTASAVGSEHVAATTLDDLLRGIAACDFIKIDVDGYDGEVLAGARELLVGFTPAIYFEWHPRLVLRAGNRVERAFETLLAAGYTEFLWFNNRGPFSHFSGPPQPREISHLAELLNPNRDGRDTHFDVLALPPQWRDLALPIADAVGTA